MVPLCYIGRCGRGRRGEAPAVRHEAGQRGHRAGHRQPAPGGIYRIPEERPLYRPGAAGRSGSHQRSWGPCAPRHIEDAEAG